jgi:hypothetical protein
MGTTNSVGSPFFFEKPKVARHRGGPQLGRSGHPGGRGAGEQVPVPYAPERVIWMPRFHHKINAAARYASPFSLPVFNKYLLAAGGRDGKGAESIAGRRWEPPASKRRTAFREVLLRSSCSA